MEERLFHFLDESLFEENDLHTLPNGRHVMKVTPLSTKILAHVTEGKVTKYEAEDDAGNPLTIFSVTETRPIISSMDASSSTTYCRICYIDEDGVVHCYHAPCLE
jgi:hypothetical protein